LLSKKRVLRHQFDATANEIRGQPGNEPKKDRSRVESYIVYARMAFVARTGNSRRRWEQRRSPSHVPMLSHANELARLIIDAAKGVPID